MILLENSSSPVEEISLLLSGTSRRRTTPTQRRNGVHQERFSEVSHTFLILILLGHSHFISDLSLSQDSRYCLTSSWDGTLRLWDLRKGQTIKRFVSHSRDVLTVAFSPDNKLPAVAETRTSRFGTLLESASSLLNRTPTLTGSHLLSSTRTPRTPSSFQLLGTRPSRFGTT